MVNYLTECAIRETAGESVRIHTNPPQNHREETDIQKSYILVLKVDILPFGVLEMEKKHVSGYIEIL